MSPAMILSLTLIAAIFIGGLEWSRADKARAREQRRWDRERREHAARAEAAATDYADAHRLDQPETEYVDAALDRDIRRFERGER